MAQQEGVEILKDKYFDIMLVGMTGQGKSTMADKLLIANPDKKKYVLPDKLKMRQGNDRVGLEDISMWLLHEEDEKNEVETHLKALVYSRTKTKPHAEVNNMRDPEDSTFTSTSFCQVFSNDTSKVRLLDVPGFEDEKAFSPARPVATHSSRPNRLYQAANNITAYNFGIMRNIIRIQSALGMRFRRVVYFLPCRGPLERANAVLEQQLQQLEYAFGHSVFECMVAVATIPRRYSLREEETMPQEEIKQCKRFFQTALGNVIGPSEAKPDIPIIFVSLAESCESILGKIQGAGVSRDGLELTFNPSTCANCGVKIGSLEGEAVICSTPQDPDGSIPYEESTCHPAFKRTLISHVLGRRITKAIVRRWPSYKAEYCMGCKQRPGEPGCMQIGQKYATWWDTYPVCHTSEVTDPVEEPARPANQSGATAQGVLPTQPEGHPEPQDGQGRTVEGQSQGIVVSATPPRLEASSEERKGT